jgi:hypothetical protein
MAHMVAMNSPLEINNPTTMDHTGDSAAAATSATTDPEKVVLETIEKRVIESFRDLPNNHRKNILQLLNDEQTSCIRQYNGQNDVDLLTPQSKKIKMRVSPSNGLPGTPPASTQGRLKGGKKGNQSQQYKTDVVFVTNSLPKDVLNNP